VEKRFYEIRATQPANEQIEQLPLHIRAGWEENRKNLQVFPKTLRNVRVIEGSIPEQWELKMDPIRVIYEVDEEKHTVTIVEVRSA